MRWLKAAIARILTGTGGATPTLNAGPVHPEPTTPTGKVTTAQDIQPQPPSSPAPVRSQREQKAVQSITRASKNTSKKQRPALTDKSRVTGGNSTQTPARPTQSPVPTQHSLTREPAPQTSPAVKRGRKKQTAPVVATVSPSTPTGSKSKTPARRTHRHAK
jgi:hypothetical protein